MRYFIALIWLTVGIVIAGPMQGMLEGFTDYIDANLSLGTFESAVIGLFPLLYWALVIGVPFIIVMRSNE